MQKVGRFLLIRNWIQWSVICLSLFIRLVSCDCLYFSVGLTEAIATLCLFVSAIAAPEWCSVSNQIKLYCLKKCSIIDSISYVNYIYRPWDFPFPSRKTGKSKLDKATWAFNFVRTSCEDQDKASCTQLLHSLCLYRPLLMEVPEGVCVCVCVHRAPV